MRFYASWYMGDPVYAEHDENCAMLISVTSVSQSWQLKRLSNIPRHVIIDSGGFRYATTKNMSPAPRDVFRQQEHIMEDIIQPVTLCPLDHPLIKGEKSKIQKDRLLSRTLANAYEFKQLVEKSSRRNYIKQMGIIQSYDLEMTIRCAYELKSIGFDMYGIGSLAMLYHPEEILRRVKAVTQIIDKDIHIFGITGLQILPELAKLGVTSVDSTTPVTNAKFNTVLYSEPYRRYLIAHSKSGQDKSRRERRIEEPLSCSCPVCQSSQKEDLLKLGKRRYVYLRSLHNYFHLKKAILSAVNSANGN